MARQHVRHTPKCGGHNESKSVLLCPKIEVFILGTFLILRQWIQGQWRHDPTLRGWVKEPVHMTVSLVTALNIIPSYLLYIICNGYFNVYAHAFSCLKVVSEWNTRHPLYRLLSVEVVNTKKAGPRTFVTTQDRPLRIDIL